MMQNMIAGIVAGVASVVLLSALAAAQDNPPKSPWKYYPEDVRANAGPGGPAPTRDINGSWAGSSAGAGAAGGRGGGRGGSGGPVLTPLGKETFALNKPLGIYSPAGTNDPHVRYCDPLGFPRNMNEQMRGITIATGPDRVFFMLMFMNIYREAWTDGRALPTNVGGRGRDAHDPTYNGYSVGRWVDDYTFVVDSTGMTPETWISRSAYPHTVEARVQERFQRTSRNDLMFSMTLDDPKLYAKPYRFGEVNFRWIPNQKFFDFTCIPSSVQQYLKEMGDPAGSDPDAARRQQQQN